MVWRQDEQGGSTFPLSTNVSHDHLGMAFTITEVKPDYVMITAKSTL